MIAAGAARRGLLAGWWRNDGVSKMRKALLAMAAMVLLGIVPLASEAACSKSGTIVRVSMKDNSSKGAHTLYLRDRVTDPFYYRAKTTDDSVAAMASTLAAQQTRVSIKGNASSCPKKGNARNMGKVIQIIAVP